MWQSWWQAGRMLWNLCRAPAETPTKGEFRTCELEAGEGRFSLDLYEPLSVYKGTLAVIHGMSPKGKADKRIQALCQALSGLGYRVVAPEIESIRKLQICPSQIDKISHILIGIANDRSMSPSGQIGVFAPSFSGGLCLAAASQPSVRERITAICTIGAFSEIESVMHYLLGNPLADSYGCFIALKKIVPLVCENPGYLQEVLDAAINDNLSPQPSQELASRLLLMTKEQRHTSEKCLNDPAHRLTMFEQARKHLTDEFRVFDVVSMVEPLSARVLLIHGKSDNVINPVESVQLYAVLKSIRKQAHLVITPFLTHGDSVFNLRAVSDVVKIMRGFAWFFEAFSETAQVRH